MLFGHGSLLLSESSLVSSLIINAAERATEESRSSSKARRGPRRWYLTVPAGVKLLCGISNTNPPMGDSRGISESPVA